VAASWTISDAWIFASLGGTGRHDGFSLQLVVAAADGINHAILSEEEFVRGIPRRVAAGLAGADPDADRYWHTDPGHELYQRTMKGRGLFGWMDGILPALEELGPPVDGELRLPPGAFERAVRAYLTKS
jgi:hypothetical protein